MFRLVNMQEVFVYGVFGIYCDVLRVILLCTVLLESQALKIYGAKKTAVPSKILEVCGVIFFQMKIYFAYKSRQYRTTSVTLREITCIQVWEGSVARCYVSVRLGVVGACRT